MTVSTINKKQLTVDTSFVENENGIEYEPRRQQQQQQPRLIMATNQPTTPPRIVPAYCAIRDDVIKIVMVGLLALLNAIPLVMDWYFNPVGVATNTFRRMATFCCYTLVIITTDLDDILNSKQLSTSKKLFCRFIGYCDWIIAFVEIAEGLLRCLEHFVIYGELLSPYILYASINKIILYVYVLKNI